MKARAQISERARRRQGPRRPCAGQPRVCQPPAGVTVTDRLNRCTRNNTAQTATINHRTEADMITRPLYHRGTSKKPELGKLISMNRMRAIAACPPCKAIKQKCDNLRPCSRCKRIGREAQCYPHRMRIVAATRRPASTKLSDLFNSRIFFLIFQRMRCLFLGNWSSNMNGPKQR